MNKFPATKKVAIILNQYKHLAPTLLKAYNDDDIKEISLYLSDLSDVKKEDVEEVIDEFRSFYFKNKGLSQGGPDSLKQILIEAFGEEKANELMNELKVNEKTPFSYLAKVDPRSLSTFLEGVHPQMIATLLSYIRDSNKCALIIQEMDKATQIEIIKGLASIEKNPPDLDAIKELENCMQKKIGNIVLKNRTKRMGGIDTIAQIMNCVDRTTENNIMTELEKEDSFLSGEIRKRMFVFEDLIKLSDRDIQRILQEDIKERELIICLKAADEDIREVFFKNMSKRKAQNIKDEMDLIPRVRKKELEEAQSKITAIAKMLDEKELISINTSADEFIG